MPFIPIVDDQPFLRELFSEELLNEGYHVESVSEASSIRGYLKDVRPDLVLLDLYLDGFRGWEIVRDIKEKNPNLPVVILTPYESFAEDPRLSEADAYVVKSFSALDGLKDKIAESLERRMGQAGW